MRWDWFPVTPGYDGRSDAFHFNVPAKYLLSDSLKHGYIPLWSDLVGGGFPVAAEGQIGGFSPINWIIFGLLPMPEAFTAALIFAFVLMTAGTYYWLRQLKVSRWSSIMGGIFSATSGFFISHIVHLNLLQAYGFIPWVFAFSEQYVLHKRLRDIGWMGFILAQMILVGYPQVFLQTLIILGIYILIRLKGHLFQAGIACGGSATIAVGLAFVQILPLLELVTQSNARDIATTQRFIHPLPIWHLLTAIHPFIFGTPSLGTYPEGGWGSLRYVESLFYPGLIPLTGLGIGMFFFIKKRSWKSKFSALTAIGIIGGLTLLLALGKSTPMGMFFLLPPLSFGRIEQRFLAFPSIITGMLAALGFSMALKKFGKWQWLGASGLLAAHSINMILLLGGLNMWAQREWLAKPEIVPVLPPSARVLSIHQSVGWEGGTAGKGWTDKEYLMYQRRNLLSPNLSLIYGIPHASAYFQQYPRRFSVIKDHLFDDSLIGRNIRKAYGVTHIIDTDPERIYRVIKTEEAVEKIYQPERFIQTRDADDAILKFGESSFQPGRDVLWESSRHPSENEKVIVMNRSIYPGWKAFLDKKELPIYPGNINQQALIVPLDTKIEDIIIQFDPLSIKVGATVSIGTLALLLFSLKKWGERRME